MEITGFNPDIFAPIDFEVKKQPINYKCDSNITNNLKSLNGGNNQENNQQQNNQQQNNQQQNNQQQNNQQQNNHKQNNQQQNNQQQNNQNKIINKILNLIYMIMMMKY